MTVDRPGGKDEIKATRRASGAGRTLAASLPRLILESRKIAAQMLRSRVSEFAEIDWPKVVAADLRKFLVQILERHLEKKLVTAGMLEKIGA